MRVSVVVCTYDPEMYEHFTEAVQSVLDQTYDDIEMVLVVDGDQALYERVLEDFGGIDDVVTHCNEENLGISASRTIGGEMASGDVVAMIDDDAVADERWVEELVRVYRETDAVAAGGRMDPDWVAGKPEFLPEEFYWLIGVTHKGFAEPGEEVRNTFGSNISFDREVFLDLGGYEPEVGRKGDRQIQAHESEIGAKLRREYGRGVVYNPDAKVYHKVFDFRTDPLWLLKRSFWQGYSKRKLVKLAPDSAGDKNEYLDQLLTDHVPGRVRRLLRAPSIRGAIQLITLFVLTGTVGLGYLFGILTLSLDQG